MILDPPSPPGTSPTVIQRAMQRLRELVLTRTADNFLCFLAEILALIYKAKPEALKSSEQERLDFILQHETMDELRSAIAEKRVEKLTYLILTELSKYSSSHLNFELFESEAVARAAALVIEYRNICVHARGFVGRASAKIFPELAEFLGRPVELTHDYVTKCRKVLENCAFDIDARATIKFSLPTIAVPVPPAHL